MAQLPVTTGGATSLLCRETVCSEHDIHTCMYAIETLYMYVAIWTQLYTCSYIFMYILLGLFGSSDCLQVYLPRQAEGWVSQRTDWP